MLDDQIKILLEALSKRSDSENTAIAVTSDHGEMLGDHGMLYKGTFLEPSIRVPFIYRPAPNEGTEQNWINNPIGLTDAFQKMINVHKRNESSKALAEEIKLKPYVCVEFDKELLIVKKAKKLCLNEKGQPLWATQIKRDPQEQENLIGIKNDFLKTNNSWARLLKIGQQEVKKRKSNEWLWRDCKL